MTLDHVACARRTLDTIQYITIATLGADDNRPWNTPVYAAFDSDLNFYWASDRQSQHSKNVRHRPEVFITIYDSTIPEGTGAGAGVYLQARAKELTDRQQIVGAHELLARRVGKTPRPPEAFLGDMPRRIYQAVPERAWVNDNGERAGAFVDIRIEIDLALLRVS
jgi:nitroimidazol reductase NimA-like FMN-containing flavoprotein (pyridoxamine 5'-phosphate oxidase superfamily)